MSLDTDAMSSLTNPSAPSASTTTMNDTIGIIAYRAGISQYINSLLQNINTITTTTTTPTSSLLASIKQESSSQAEVAPENKTLPDPNVEIQVLVNDKIKPDLIKDENIEKLPNSSFKTLSTKKSNLSSVATQRSNAPSNATTTGSQVETNSNREAQGAKGGSRTTEKMHLKRGGIKDDKEEIENYDLKRKLKLAKRRSELESRIDSWWRGVQDALPLGSISFSDLPPEIPSPIPSPTIPYAYLKNSSSAGHASKPESNSQSSTSVSSTSKLPPLKLYNSFPSKNDQLNCTSSHSSTFMPQDIFSTPCIGSNLGFGFAFDILDDQDHNNNDKWNVTSKSPIFVNPIVSTTQQQTQQEQQQQQQQQYINSLVFSENVCKATLRCTNSKSFNNETINHNKCKDSRDESILDLLDKSEDWDIPYKHEMIKTNQDNINQNQNQSRSKSPFRVVVNGEMPTPRPITAGLSFWG